VAELYEYGLNRLIEALVTSFFFFKINRSAKWEEAVDSNSAADGDRRWYNNTDVDYV